MNTDLQDIIAQSAIKAFNAGYTARKQEEITDEQTVTFFNAGFEAGKRHVLEAVDFVKFDHHDLEVAAISDLLEELEDRAKAYRSNTDFSASGLGKRGNDETR